MVRSKKIFKILVRRMRKVMIVKTILNPGKSSKQSILKRVNKCKQSKTHQIS